MNVESNLIDWESAPDGYPVWIEAINGHVGSGWCRDDGDRYTKANGRYWTKPEEGFYRAHIKPVTARPTAPKEVWSRDGLDGNWNFDSLAELIKSDYGHGSDSAGPMDDDGSLQIGDIVHRGIKCYDDPGRFVPDADDVANHMYEQAQGSDAGEWADNYPDLSKEAEAALEVALEPLKAWARKHCQPTFFTVEKTTTHELTEEEVRAALTTAFVLSPEKFEAFEAQLDANPLAENARAQQLLARPKPWTSDAEKEEGGAQ